MGRAFIFILTVAFCTGGSYAAPPVQRHRVGVVRSVNLLASVVTITSGDEKKPVDYVVDTERTRCRRDGAPARLADLAAGQPVEIYYRREAGAYVATEISWKSEPVAHP